MCRCYGSKPNQTFAPGAQVIQGGVFPPELKPKSRYENAVTGGTPGLRVTSGNQDESVIYRGLKFGVV